SMSGSWSLAAMMRRVSFFVFFLIGYSYARTTRLSCASPAAAGAANDVSAPDNKNSVSSRGWRSAPRDLTPAQALARYDRRVLRFRRDGPLCDLIVAGGPSPSRRLGMTPHSHAARPNSLQTSRAQ